MFSLALALQVSHEEARVMAVPHGLTATPSGDVPVAGHEVFDLVGSPLQLQAFLVGELGYGPEEALVMVEMEAHEV